MQALLKKAYEGKRGKFHEYEITSEELELYLAYIQGDISFRQVQFALGRSHGFATSFVKRCTLYMFQRSMLAINYNNQIVRYKPKQYTV